MGEAYIFDKKWEPEETWWGGSGNGIVVWREWSEWASRYRGEELVKSHHREVAKGHFKHRDASLQSIWRLLNAIMCPLLSVPKSSLMLFWVEFLCENCKGGELSSELTQCRIERADRGANK